MSEVRITENQKESSIARGLAEAKTIEKKTHILSGRTRTRVETLPESEFATGKAAPV
jgi:hypothetical protein